MTDVAHDLKGLTGQDDAPITEMTFLIWARNERVRVDRLRFRIVWGLCAILVLSALALTAEGVSLHAVSAEQTAYETAVERQFYEHSKALASNQVEVCHYAQNVAKIVATNELQLAKIESSSLADSGASQAIVTAKAALWTKLSKQLTAAPLPKCDGLPGISPIR